MLSTPNVMKRSKPLKAATSRSSQQDTPPDSPTRPFNVTELARQFFDAAKHVQESESKEASSAGPQVEGNAKPAKQGPELQGLNSRQSMKCTFSSMCKCDDTELPPTARDPKTYTYKIVESAPTAEVTELDEYVFIVRMRIGKCYGFDKKVLWLTWTQQGNFKTYGIHRFQENSLRDIL